MRTALLSLLLLLDLFLCSLSLPSLDSNGSLAEFPNATALESNTSRPGSKEDSFADMIDRALEKEFTENDEQTQATDPGSFNNSVNEQQAVLETVARVKSKKNDTKEEKSFQLQDVFNLDSENRAEDMPTLIDRKDNVFIISNLKSKYPVLQLDLRLISDLVIVIVFATCGGIAFACAGQPVITGYLLAGSIVGPGGFNFVSELVQVETGLVLEAGVVSVRGNAEHKPAKDLVETVAQFGVIFLLFALGLEFSTAKLRVVRAVALCGGELSEGVFIGVFLSMSSTAVDCAVGLLFALLPVLGGTSGVLQGVISMTKSLVVLIAFLAILSILSRTCVPWFLKLMISLSSQTNELYQLAAVAFCLVVAWCSDKLGLSLELGSFAAGVMISTTEFAQHTLEQVEPIRNLFAALFLASIGMLIHGHFLWNHIDILLAAVILVIIIKTVVVATVVKGFRYNNKTSLLVGMSLAQIGEFAFVLLSRASNVHLVEGKLYLLLLGTTALSLVTTPLLFKLIPAVVHLGVLLRWFSPDIPIEVLVGPSDWEDHSLGKEGVERYGVHNLPDCYSCPALYELGLVISGAHSGSKIGNLDPVPVYLGQTDNVRTRLQRYGRDGAHLDGLFSEAFSKGYSIAFRWAPVLVGPSDWEDHSLWKGAERYRVQNLPNCYSCPGLYELGLVISGAHSGSKIGNLDPVPFYLGQTGNVRTRLQCYGREGAHLENGDSNGQVNDYVLQQGHGAFSEAFSRGYTIAYRWAPMVQFDLPWVIEDKHKWSIQLPWMMVPHAEGRRLKVEKGVGSIKACGARHWRKFIRYMCG
ncbi:hypothetical protein C3L33_03574, partial [Rhododendron williamsianum]